MAGSPKATVKGISKDEIEEATEWVGGLDRIHKTRGILTCLDFTATPFAPTGKQSGEETLFGWIVSDFGLNDAIESGLVKTPQVVVRDDGQLTADYKSRLYHIYMDPDVHGDLSRKAEGHVPLPDLVTNAYYLLGKDWLETQKKWEGAGFKTPPVMITVANRTETAARVHYALTHGKVRIEELTDAGRILHIDSKVLEEAGPGMKNWKSLSATAEKTAKRQRKKASGRRRSSQRTRRRHRWQTRPPTRCLVFPTN